MKKGLTKHPQDVRRAKGAIARNLKILEEKLKSFRSSSPDKWIEEVGKGCGFENSDLLTARSTSEESSSSANSEEIIKTIAENEDFIKQKIGGIEDELRLLSAKVMPDGLLGLQEDLRMMEDGLNDLQEVVRKCDPKSANPPIQVQQGLDALHNALNELSDDARTLIKNDSLVQTSEDFQLTIEESLEEIANIDDDLRDGNCSHSKLEEGLGKVHDKFNSIKTTLDKLNQESSSLKEVHKGLDEVKNEVKPKIRELINIPNKSDENSSETAELFDNLDENDFINFSSTVGYEITDFIIRREESEIALLRDNFAENLESPKASTGNTNNKSDL